MGADLSYKKTERALPCHSHITN